MDYPLFSIDVYGGRLVIGLIAILRSVHHCWSLGWSRVVYERGIRAGIRLPTN
jgi:hypothetical protein